MTSSAYIRGLNTDLDFLSKHLILDDKHTIGLYYDNKNGHIEYRGWFRTHMDGAFSDSIALCTCLYPGSNNYQHVKICTNGIGNIVLHITGLKTIKHCEELRDIVLHTMIASIKSKKSNVIVDPVTIISNQSEHNIELVKWAEDNKSKTKPTIYNGDIIVNLMNACFDIGFYIQIPVALAVLKTYGLIPYDSKGRSSPGLKIRYYYNKKNKVNGVCNCSKKCREGFGKGNGYRDCKKLTISIQTTGKSQIMGCNGENSEDMKQEAFSTIMQQFISFKSKIEPNIVIQENEIRDEISDEVFRENILNGELKIKWESAIKNSWSNHIFDKTIYNNRIQYRKSSVLEIKNMIRPIIINVVEIMDLNSLEKSVNTLFYEYFLGKFSDENLVNYMQTKVNKWIENVENKTKKDKKTNQRVLAELEIPVSYSTKKNPICFTVTEMFDVFIEEKYGKKFRVHYKCNIALAALVQYKIMTEIKKRLDGSENKIKI
jgi:hypothetical protein